MELLVCPLSRVAELVAGRAPERVVSLLDPGSEFPELGAPYADRHLRLSFHDVSAPVNGMSPISAEQVGQLLEFVARWDRISPILFHCRAGISRSTAAAFVAACWCDPQTDERELALELRRVAPNARPNQGLIRVADRLMNRAGRMTEAMLSTGRNLDWVDLVEAEPFRLALNGDARKSSDTNS